MTVAAALKSSIQVKPEEAYTGPVCYGLDGWHYTVVDDPDTKARNIAVAQAHLDHSVATGDTAREVAERQALVDAQASTPTKPGERLYTDGKGNYRLAVDGDPNHHDRFHERFVTLRPELTPEQVADLKALLDSQEGGAQ